MKNKTNITGLIGNTKDILSKGNTRRQVELLLFKFEDCRNYDEILLDKFDKYFFENETPFKRQNKMKNIIRIRAMIQNEMKLYLPTDEKIRARRLNCSLAKRGLLKSTWLKTKDFLLNRL